MKNRTNLCAAILLIVGLLQMSGDLLGWPILKGIGAATAASPAPKVFTSLRGYEAYSTRFYLEWKAQDGIPHSLQIIPENYAKLRGPYNRRNAFGAILAGGPLLITDEKLQPMFQEVSTYALSGDAIILREMGIDPTAIAGNIRVRYEAVTNPPANSLPRELPSQLEIKCN
jgi:hypothetical protein